MQVLSNRRRPCLPDPWTSCSAARRQQRTSTTGQPRATNEPTHTSRTFSIPRHNTTQRERSTQQKQRRNKGRALDSTAIDPKHTSPRDEPHCTPLARTTASENNFALCRKFPLQPVQNQRKTCRNDNPRNSTPQHTLLDQLSFVCFLVFRLHRIAQSI